MPVIADCTRSGCLELYVLKTGHLTGARYTQCLLSEDYMVWSRRLSNIMGDAADFCKALTESLKNTEVIAAFSAIVQASMKRDVDELRAEISALRDVVKARDVKINELEKEIASLKTEQDNLEQYTRRNTLCISRLPEKAYENVTEKALKLFNKKMGVPITVTDIDRVHRYGKKKDNRPRGIMVKFATYRARSAVFRAKASLRPGAAHGAPAWTAAGAAGLTTPTRTEPSAGEGSDSTNADDSATPGQHGEPTEDALEELKDIFISEDLTGPRQFLLWQARIARRARAVKKCWSHDGQVLVEDTNGKIHPINSASELQNISGMEVKTEDMG